MVSLTACIVNPIIAVAVALLAVNKWLQGFVCRIDVHWWVFAITGILAILIALAAISIQVVGPPWLTL
jgi:putative ABC transport system permease protein